MTPKDEMRVLTGLVVQPLVAALAAFFLFPLLDYTNRAIGLYSGHFDYIQAARSLAFGAGLAAVFVTLLGALPAIAWLSNRPVTMSTTLAAGAILGNAPAAILLFLVAVHGDDTPSMYDALYGLAGWLRTIAFGTLIGLVCATSFWWIAGRRLSSRPKPA
jgi:hypothetical protein